MLEEMVTWKWPDMDINLRTGVVFYFSIGIYLDSNQGRMGGGRENWVWAAGWWAGSEHRILFYLCVCIKCSGFVHVLDKRELVRLRREALLLPGCSGYAGGVEPSMPDSILARASPISNKNQTDWWGKEPGARASWIWVWEVNGQGRWANALFAGPGEISTSWVEASHAGGLDWFLSTTYFPKHKDGSHSWASPHVALQKNYLKKWLLFRSANGWYKNKPLN